MHRPGGVPCLLVRDLKKAAAYYHRFFGFVPAAQAPDGVVMRGHGTELRLRQAPSGWTNSRDIGLPIPDAMICVRQPDVLFHRLDDWGAHLVPSAELGDGWEECYGIRDCYGNVIAVGPADGLVARLARPFALSVDRTREWWDDRSERRVAAGHVVAFRDFYQRLTDQSDIVYLHFNAGLLHWVVKTESYIPEQVNLVLVGSGLPAEERAWVSANLRRPFHHVGERLDDAAALELLFATSRHHFGWLALGCLVLNNGLFDDFLTIDATAFLNCTWSWDAGSDVRLANPYLLFLNVDAIRHVRDQGLGVGPGVYTYERRNRQVEGRRCYTRIPTPGVRQRLSQLLPPDASGSPQIPGGLATFETTMLYQLMAYTCGLHVTQTRSLTGFNHIRGGRFQDDSSDELLYIGGLGRADVLEEFSGYFHDDDIRLRYAIAEHLTLASTSGGLPPFYGRRLTQVAALLADYGLGADQVEAACRQHLTEERGMSIPATDAVIGLGTHGGPSRPAI